MPWRRVAVTPPRSGSARKRGGRYQGTTRNACHFWAAGGSLRRMNSSCQQQHPNRCCLQLRRLRRRTQTPISSFGSRRKLMRHFLLSRLTQIRCWASCTPPPPSRARPQIRTPAFRCSLAKMWSPRLVPCAPDSRRHFCAMSKSFVWTYAFARTCSAFFRSESSAAVLVMSITAERHAGVCIHV